LKGGKFENLPYQGLYFVLEKWRIILQMTKILPKTIIKIDQIWLTIVVRECKRSKQILEIPKILYNP